MSCCCYIVLMPIENYRISYLKLLSDTLSLIWIDSWFTSIFNFLLFNLRNTMNGCTTLDQIIFLVYLDLFVGVFIIQIYHSKGIQTTSHLCMGLYKMKRWIKRLLNQVKYEFECGEAGYVHYKRNSEERLQFQQPIIEQHSSSPCERVSIDINRYWRLIHHRLIQHRESILPHRWLFTGSCYKLF